MSNRRSGSDSTSVLASAVAESVGDADGAEGLDFEDGSDLWLGVTLIAAEEESVRLGRNLMIGGGLEAGDFGVGGVYGLPGANGLKSAEVGPRRSRSAARRGGA